MLSIKSQTGSITQEITRIHSFIDTAVGPTILRVLKPRLKLEVSRSITGFTNTLGTPSTYRDENQYKGYYLIKTTELDSMYTSIEQYVKDIRVLCQTLDGVWKKAESISQKISSARGPLYSNSDSVYTTLTKEGGKWYLNLAAKANDADNFIASASSEDSKIISDSDSIKASYPRKLVME